MAERTVDFRDLETVLEDRRANAPAGSYSAKLLADPELAARKIVEEGFELGMELTRHPVDTDRVASEAADLVFHTLAGLVGAGVPFDAVLDELAARRRPGRETGGPTQQEGA